MKKPAIFLFVLFYLGQQYAGAQNEKFKALFIYNFTKYIEWPASVRQGDFIIGVLGSSPLVNELEIIASKQKVGLQNIVIKVFNSVEEIDNCHMLYLPPGKSNLIKNVENKINGKSILLISDKAGLALQGAGINFIYDGDKIKYEINKQNIEKNGLAVNSTLFVLGTVVQN